MNSTTSRRRLLKRTASLAAAPFVTTFGLMAARNAQATGCSRFDSMAASPYGKVAPVADQTTGLALLRLPPGFSYKSMGWRDDPMSDRNASPGRHDGMAVVRSRRVGPSTELTLIRNHELGAAPLADIRLTGAPIYDHAGGGTLPSGGTTTLTVRDGKLVEIRPSLGGTLSNCAGGPTPWETWLSCEESTADRSGVGGKKHGYVFEVSAVPGETTARPIVAMGRFRHEAVAVDPSTRFAYLTEDADPVSALYRFEPANKAGGVNRYAEGGRLKAARVKSIVASCHASVREANRRGFAAPFLGDEYEIEWVEVADPDAAPAAIDVLGTRLGASGPFAQAWAAGCARMRRGEGIWHHAGKVYVVDTAAGGAGGVWELTLATQRIKAIYVSHDQRAGNHLDNITASPRGGLLCCEDGGVSDDGSLGSGTRLVGLTAGGAPYLFAKNNLDFSADQYAAAGKVLGDGVGDQRGAEFCGACFDPTGRVLFVNIQTPGITFAITGPWDKGNL